MSVLNKSNLFNYPVRRLILHFLWVLGLLAFLSVCRYQPPLIGVADFETQLVSDPGYWGSPIKQIQSFLELQPCAYELFGWEGNTHFYYASTCYGREQLWRYDWQQERSYAVAAIPPQLHVQPSGDSAVLTAVRADGLRPKEHESITRPLLLVNNSGLTSPDEHTIAFLTQQVYSVYDVVVIRTSSD